MDTTVIIIGGGIAGLTAALELAGSGVDVLLFEKKNYPSHRVCGEYVSNEVRSYLERLGLGVDDLGAVPVNRLQVTSTSGKIVQTALGQGGFGLSRYCLDHALYQLCIKAGVKVITNTTISQFDRTAEGYEVQSNAGQRYRSHFLIGSFGKRSVLDIRYERAFVQKPSPYLAVKYHIRYDHPPDLISLHNFPEGYCGISAVEDGKSCLCYLTKRQNLSANQGNIRRMELETLSKNPWLKNIFQNAEFLYEKPLVINEVSFRKKSCVEDGMLMAGDAAGLITPLCGNGMAMAAHSAMILSRLLVKCANGNFSKHELEMRYQTEWNKNFRVRLAVGQYIQSLFGKDWLTENTLRIFGWSPLLTRSVVRMTHGAEIPVS